MQYILTGFTHDLDSRVFAFECIGVDRVRTEYTVKANLGLVRRYGIRVQELPLLCRAVLERRNEDQPERKFTYSEADMCVQADVRAALRDAAALKKKGPRKPLGENVGAAWRRPQI